MTKVIAGITTSVDGYVAGPNDGPGKGLGEGGEALHYWVFGGPWTYDAEPSGQAGRRGRRVARRGDVRRRRRRRRALDLRGRGALGRREPVGAPVLHRHPPPRGAARGRRVHFVAGLEEAVARAREAAGDKNVHVMGGADVIRQALAAGLVDELSIIVAPVILGGGKRLFDGFTTSLELEHLGVRQSPFATFIDY